MGHEYCQGQPTQLSCTQPHPYGSYLGTKLMELYL